MSSAIWITSKLPPAQRAALERLVFFNANQHRVRGGIEQSIRTYGAPEIYEHEGALRVRVGSVRDVQTLYAVHETGRPVGVAVFVRLEQDRFVVLHVVVEPRGELESGLGNPVLLRLMNEIRRAARITRGVDRIELPYKNAHAVRLQVNRL
ncbi:MAG: hypothetical protein U1F35_20310 [Steroidobacteraceae bacterium]